MIFVTFFAIILDFPNIHDNTMATESTDVIVPTTTEPRKMRTSSEMFKQEIEKKRNSTTEN